jgi:hypothetical protein
MERNYFSCGCAAFSRDRWFCFVNQLLYAAASACFDAHVYPNLIVVNMAELSVEKCWPCILLPCRYFRLAVDL